MAFNLTYGSFGDAITTAQLVHRLVQTLSDSRGSARELQDLVVELRLYHNVLQHLMFFWESRKQCPELDELANVVKPAILDCKDTIEAFLEKAVNKYGRSLLRRIGSRKTVWDVIKMIQWNLCEKEDVEKLRDQLSRSKLTIQMVQIQANTLASDQDRLAVSNKLASLIEAETQADENINARFAELMDNLEKGTEAISRIEEGLNAMSPAVTSINNSVLAIRSTTHSIEQDMISLRGMLSRTSLYDHNVVFIEDALGWTIPIALDYHPSWETLHSMLLDQFAHHRSPGLKLVKSRRYIIQDDRTGKDANLNKPLSQTVRPGQKLVMSMLFRGDWSIDENDPNKRHLSKCPSCDHINNVDDPSADVICSNGRCQLIYRMVIDVSDMDEKSLDDWLEHKFQLKAYSHDDDDDEDDQSGSHEKRLQEELSFLEGAVQSPDIFKRVRFLSRWEDRIESRGKLGREFGEFSFWDYSDKISDIQIQVAVMIKLHMIVQNARGLHCIFGFMGRSRKQASLVIIILSKSKKDRRRFVKVLKRLDWLGVNSRFLVFDAPESFFGGEEFWTITNRRSRDPNSVNVRASVEAGRRLNQLKGKEHQDCAY